MIFCQPNPDPTCHSGYMLYIIFILAKILTQNLDQQIQVLKNAQFSRYKEKYSFLVRIQIWTGTERLTNWLILSLYLLFIHSLIHSFLPSENPELDGNCMVDKLIISLFPHNIHPHSSHSCLNSFIHSLIPFLWTSRTGWELHALSTNQWSLHLLFIHLFMYS